ncbi:Phosphoglucomutase [Rhynchospora pubera]|uniref:Phosphoglucomutase n=1 Tax=Rhynchospora pubera TaxID=906938 RepID=A0AAV8D304_9POAL|nr:Phosphoglucomutase [Rhynchospora pubera]
MAASNGVRRLWTGENGLLSTLASSAVIRESIGPNGVKATCAFIFKACHNPDGPYLSKLGVTTFKGPTDEKFEVEVISSTNDYLKLTKSMMHDPKEDFGGCPSNLNLTYTKERAAHMKLEKLCKSNPPEFGAAIDADEDNYIIFDKNFFITPSDSIAIIAANAKMAIPYFADGLKGFARTIITSAALDAVAQDLRVICHEVPREPKPTTDLMDAKSCSIYGEENFSIVLLFLSNFC